MSYHQRVRAEVETWLDDPDADVWGLFGVNCGGYSERIDIDLADVLQEMANRKFWADTEYRELLSYLWCSVGVGEYGTSPRGAWLTGGLEDLVPRMIVKIREQWDKPL